VIATVLALLAAGTPQTAVEAERAFAVAAQADGQWSAFRTFASDKAFLFTPEPVPAGPWLKDRPEPPIPVMWWPRLSFRSCDGTLAVNTGPWMRAAHGGTGTFTTIWYRDMVNGTPRWRWHMDHGRDTPTFVPAGPKVAEVAPDCATGDQKIRLEGAYRTISARTEAGRATAEADALKPHLAKDIVVQLEDVMPQTGVAALPAFKTTGLIRSIESDDNSLSVRIHAITGKPGAHDLQLWQWRGKDGWKLVLYETVGIR